MGRKAVSATCPGCPFRRASLPGYLGESSGDPVEFLNSFANGDAQLPCHQAVDWGGDGAQARAMAAPVCMGSLVYLRNQCKLSRDPVVARLAAEVEPDRDDYLASAQEFCAHHGPPGLKVVVFGSLVLEADGLVT